MKILIVHRYFWPDHANCGQVLYQLAKHLESSGHQVDILTSLPSRNLDSFNLEKKKFELLNNIKIVRINLNNEIGKFYLRIFNALKLGFFTNLLALQNKYDIILATSVPPVLGGFFSAIASKIKKSKFIYFCMDLYPEIGKISQDFSHPLIYRLLEKIDNWNCKKASNIIVHSIDMKKTLENRKNINKFKINIINNFSVPTDLNKFSFNKNIKFSKKNKLSMIFAGNVGRFQGLESIVDAMELINYRKDIELMILGNGSVKKKLIERAKNKNANVIFFGHQSIEIAKKTISLADIGIVSLKPKIYNYAYPGKVMTYLEQGKPFISTIEPESDLTSKMKSENFGFYVDILDIKAISNLFLRLADNSSWKKPMNFAAKKAYEKNFSQSKILYKWSKLFK
jgi:glycosyltransferase involved in cell wall biosynthesis